MMRRYIKILAVAISLFVTQFAYSREFLNTILHINVGFAYCFPFGNLTEHENNDYKLYSAYEDRNIRPTHYDSSINVYMDLAPFKPFILGNESNALKIGIRGGYRFHQIKQNLVVKPDENSEKDYSGTLFSYDRWMIGPVLHYAPVITPLGLKEGYSAKGGLTFFLLFGQIVGGELTASPALHNANPTEFDTKYGGNWKSKCEGYAIDIGIGGEISVLSINIGINIYYTYISLKLKKDIYETLGRDLYVHEAVLEIYMGIPISWW